MTVAVSPDAGAAEVAPTSAAWCTDQGSAVDAWVTTTPRIPVCGPGPAYGGTWQYVDVPGPFGALGTYFNATSGFQCVELAERYLAVVDGLAPVKANGATVAMNYHAAYPTTTLVRNGSPGAVGHAPAVGDVISFSWWEGFSGTDGHVAVVVRSSVDSAGDGTVTVAQQNVSASDYLYTLGLTHWRLYDPSEPGDAEFQYAYAEWLSVPPLRTSSADAAATGLVLPTTPALTLLPRIAHRGTDPGTAARR